MITPSFIQKRLDAVASERNITIRYACESGSRAWGLASTDSDYDVRFIYQNPRDWYLQLARPKDMIGPLMELDGELDLVGWDLRKVLIHVAGSNAGVIEWLHSPFTYRQEPPFLAAMRALACDYFQPAKAAAHYLGIARSAERAGYREEDNTWNLKKYCYLMRPVLAARHVLTERTIPAVAFDDLADRIADSAVRCEVEELVAVKETVPESHRLVLPPGLATYFSNLHSRLQEELPQVSRREVDYAEINSFFRSAIGY